MNIFRRIPYNPNMKSAVVYYRVSTDKQGESKLGLEAQKNSVEGFCRSRGMEITMEFTDVESGKVSTRKGLGEAIAETKRIDGVLVIAKLDRLSRNFMFIMALKESGVEFVACDMPDANTLTIGIMALMAQQERELISERTSAAIQAKLRRGEKWGNPQCLTQDGRKKGWESIRQKRLENENNRRAAELVETLAQQKLTLQEIAERLNRSGFRTSKGCQFQPTTVMRLRNFRASA